MKIIFVLMMMMWSNRIGNQVCHPSGYQEPHCLEDLRRCVQEAVAKEQKVRVMGNGYSISDIGCTNGLLLNLKKMHTILSIDKEKREVRVEAGILLAELNEKLAEEGLALPNQPAIDAISLGGALSTGVHGTGNTGSLSSFVKEIELLSADGTIRKLSPDSDPEAFYAASVGLGSLGVIYAVTLRCEPLFYLTVSSQNSTIEEVLKNYKTSKNRDFLQFLWNGENGQVVVQTWDKTRGGTPGHKALPYYTIDENDKDLFSEFAFPVDRLTLVVEKIQALLPKYREKGARIADFNIRFGNQERSYLSPATDGPVFYCTFCLFEEDKYLAIYKDFEQEMLSLKGRPHWGKLHFLDYEKALRLYGSKLEQFIAVKQRLDPQGVFSNAFTERVLQPAH